MYASNEDEDWVYLQETPPTNTILRGAVNLVDQQLSSSSSSSSSNSLISDRSVSLSSISSTELEHAENDDELNSGNLLLSQQLISTPVVNEEEILPTKTIIIQDDDDDDDNQINPDTPPTIHDNDLLNTGFDLSKTLSLTNSNESLSLPNQLRHRTNGVHDQQTGLYNSEVYQSTPISENVKPRKRYERKSNLLIPCTLIILLFTVPFILGKFAARLDQPMINKIVAELDKTNQRLNEIKDIPIGNIEEKLTKQFEDKLQNIINQKMAWHDHEKTALMLQIRELRRILNITQQHLTNTIHQLTNENGRLQEQIKSMNHRLQVVEQHPKDTKTCTEGVNCTKSSTSPIDSLVTNIFKQTASIAEDTSTNLSGLFEHLSASVSNIVDHRHEYVEESKRKLSDFAGSSTTEQVQTRFRRGVENLSSSLRKAKLTYSTWLKSRAQRREQARMERNENVRQEQTPKKHLWRWSFQHNHDRIRFQTVNKEHVCHSKSYFPVNQICSMKNWMVKLFRP